MHLQVAVVYTQELTPCFPVSDT